MKWDRHEVESVANQLKPIQTWLLASPTVLRERNATPEDHSQALRTTCQEKKLLTTGKKETPDPTHPILARHLQALKL